MAVFKPIGNHGRSDGRGRNIADLDRYLSFGDGLAASEAMEEYLAFGHAAKASRIVEFRHTDNMLTNSPVGWSREMEDVRRAAIDAADAAEVCLEHGVVFARDRVNGVGKLGFR